MKLWMIMFAALFTLSSAIATEKVIYGDDDRLDLFEVADNLHLELAKSTAAMIDASSISNQGDKAVISGTSLQERGICSGEKFSKQITSANCSGFLVGPDLLVTAGHCIRRQADCDSYKWVFDYGISDQEQEGSSTFQVPAGSVYGCKKIIAQSLDRATQDDYALIQLERKVEDRRILTVRKEGKVADKTELVVIGHPTGLPTKVAAGAYVRGNLNSHYFVSNLDTFGGNSGSAVFDSKTGVVEGILVRGETDYEYDYNRGCRVPKYCSNEGCRGEDVTRITNIKALSNPIVDVVADVQ